MSSEEIKAIRDGIIETTGIRKKKVEFEPFISSDLRKAPFYKQLLTEYLGSSFTRKMYNDLFDEVAKDVDFRIKQMNLYTLTS
ncbi:hypothetical protein ES705_33937 [subsurface metagenome]